MEMSYKVREGKQQNLAHHSLIKLIVLDALNHLRILVIWNKFVDMDRVNFIKTQALTLDKTPASII